MISITTVVMIFFMKFGYAGGTAMAEFDSMDSCHAARQQILRQAADEGWGSIFIVCAVK